MLPADTLIERRSDGAILARSPHRLGPYATKITERLEHWALDSPDRTFLAERDAAGAWRRLTYADALRRVRPLAQSLLDRRVSRERPLLILSGNSLEHALLALAAMYAGVPYAPVSPSYSLLAREYTTLRALWRALTPGMIFAADGARFERALASVAGPDDVIVTSSSAPLSLQVTSIEELEQTPPRSEVDQAHARVGPETVAKILYTSGSTGAPKGVINTQRMLCANQEMLRATLPLLVEEPPILCDWLPWNHTFGGNHNFGIVLYNGGTLYIDEGKPTAGEFDKTIANLNEIATTAYFNVPRGYDLLVPRLAKDARFAKHFFSRMKMIFCAAAALRQHVADELARLAEEARGGERLPFVTGLGATESAPFALCAGDAAFTGGRVGVPVPGVELKLAPGGGQMEGRLRGPNITPGYWGDAALTAAAFDDEGYYKLGDALAFFDPDDPSQGFTFQGRLTEDFKLSTGTWVRVGPLRARLLAHLGDLVHDVVIAGHDREFVSALVFPNLANCGELAQRAPGSCDPRELLQHPYVIERFEERLASFAAANVGSSTAVARALLLEEPPAIDAQETTEKGSVNQKAVLSRRSALVEQLYGAAGTGIVIDIAKRTVRQ
ncbi:MAG TPA: feruloyl-CoA synthase [Vicinamibacterales bacterium]|jgi:feruloyl-CoA synthase